MGFLQTHELGFEIEKGWFGGSPSHNLVCQGSVTFLLAMSVVHGTRGSGLMEGCFKKNHD